MMVELERSRDGFVKSFSIKVAEDALRKAVSQEAMGTTYWKLPEDSNYKLDKSKSLVLKAKKKMND